jgi:PAS domain S-box-containing protein
MREMNEALIASSIHQHELTEEAQAAQAASVTNARRLAAMAESLRRSEQRWRLALDSAELGSWSMDPASASVATDERFRAIFGITYDRIDYEQLVALIHPEDQPRVREAVASSIRPDDPAPYEIEYRVVHADGTTWWILAKGRANFHGQGEQRQLVSFDGTVSDISQRKHMEREREELLDREQAARQEAEGANRAKDLFLAMLSHEIRTPLNAIVGWADLLAMEGNTPEEIQEAVEAIQRNAQSQARLIGDLLDVSRIISGKLKMEIHACDLRAIVHAAMEVVRPAARARGIQLTADLACPSLPGGTESGIHCDADRMQQVIWNLLTNAIKFTPAGGKVSITLQRDPDEAAMVRLDVTDTGSGLGPDLLPHVFERFHQGQKSPGGESGGQGGLGLGLSIVKHIMEAHGGTASVISEGEGTGSTFTLKLPIRQ